MLAGSNPGADIVNFRFHITGNDHVSLQTAAQSENLNSSSVAIDGGNSGANSEGELQKENKALHEIIDEMDAEYQKIFQENKKLKKQMEKMKKKFAKLDGRFYYDSDSESECERGSDSDSDSSECDCVHCCNYN